MSKTIEITIETNGELKIETGDMSGSGHYTAGEYIRTVERESGGVVKREKIKKQHSHSHEHVHQKR